MRVSQVNLNFNKNYLKNHRDGKKSSQIGCEYYSYNLMQTNTSFKSNLLTKSELTSRLLKMGLGGLDSKSFQTVIRNFATSQGYSNVLLERFEALACKAPFG